jgi:hypothetical protein
MAVSARVDRGADGRWNFEGDTSSVSGAAASGGGGAGAAITDIRFNPDSKAIEALIGGVWVAKISFHAYDD